MKKGVTLIGIIITIFVILLSIGFAAFVDTLSISDAVAQVRPEVNTRISAVTTSSSYISNLNYNVNEIIGTASIPNNAAVTFNTTITTYGNVKMALSDIAVFNGNNQISNVTITPNLTNSFERICDNNNICTLNKSKTIPITVTNNTDSVINTDNFKVKLTYTPFYSVTYNDDVIDYVLANSTFTYAFQSDTPSSVTVDSGTCGTPSIANDTLTITNVTSDLVLTGSSGMSGSGTWSDPYLIDSNTFDYSNLDAASYKFINQNVKGNPEITVDSNGKIIRYEMTNYGDSGLAFSNESINTGVLAFDGEKLTIDLVFTTKLGDSNNNGKEILAAMTKIGTNTYSGFMFLNFKGGRMYVNTLNNQTIGSNGNGGSQFIYFSITGNSANKMTQYTVRIVYDPSEYNDNFNITMNPGSIDRTDTMSNISGDMSNVTVTLGGNGITNNNMASMTVQSFSITKG